MKQFRKILHSLDFAFWYDKRPLWDIGMIALCLGGFTTSGLGLFLGVRRMRRSVRSAAADLRPAADVGSQARSEGGAPA